MTGTFSAIPDFDENKNSFRLDNDISNKKSILNTPMNLEIYNTSLNDSSRFLDPSLKFLDTIQSKLDNIREQASNRSLKMIKTSVSSIQKTVKNDENDSNLLYSNTCAFSDMKSVEFKGKLAMKLLYLYFFCSDEKNINFFFK